MDKAAETLGSITRGKEILLEHEREFELLLDRAVTL
jgi:hypothetical protein